MPAADALTAHLTVLEDWASARHAAYMGYYADSERESERATMRRLDPDLYDNDGIVRTLRGCETFYIHPLMQQVVAIAAEQLGDEVIVEATDLPSLSGFMYLPQPWEVVDIRRQTLRFAAAIWRVRAGGVDVYWLTDKNDLLDYPNRHMHDERPDTWSQMYRWDMSIAGRLIFGQDAGSTVTWGDADGPLPFDAPVPDVHYAQDTERPGGFRAFIVYPGSDERVEVPRGANRSLRFMVAAWLLMGQTLAAKSADDTAPKRLRRRAERENRPDAKVTIVELRRREVTSDGSREVHWTHQWLVRGHWRRQRYNDPDRPGETIVRRIYIAPFMKGDPEAPLLVRDHVYSLTR